MHLSAPTEFGRLAERRAQVACLERHLAPKRLRSVVAGDFNSFPGMDAYKRMRAMLRDVIEEHARARGGSPAPTWGPTAAAPRVARIDHVMTAGLSARRVQLVRIEGSDHSALFVELALD